MPTCPFVPNSRVLWASDAPSPWRWIWTPGPMTVISARWDTGAPSEYSRMFHPEGIPRQPGWIVTVEYDPDASGYYDPPLSLIFGKKLFHMEVHEMWLILESSSELVQEPRGLGALHSKHRSLSKCPSDQGH